MPKPPPADYFRVTILCPKELLGELLATHTRLGLNDVHFDLVSDVRTFRKNETAPSITGVSASDFLLDWIKQHPSFKAIEAVRAHLASGGSGVAIYPALATLVGRGALKNVGTGQYARTDVKALAPPPKKGNENRVNLRDRYKVTNRDIVLNLARGSKGPFTVTLVKKNFAKLGRPLSSVTSIIAFLVKKGHLKPVGHAEYELRERKPVTNSGDAPGEVTHG